MATKAAEKPKTEKAKADEAPGEDGVPAKKKSKKKIILFILLALLLVGGGSAALWYTMKPKAEVAEGEDEAEESATAESAAEKVPPVFVTLENFLVNLRDDDGDHYLQLGIVLEVSDAHAVDDVKLQMPRIRNAILLLLSSKKSSDIASLEGKQQLAQAILQETRKPMDLPEPNKGIEGVYFSAFVIQ